MSDFWEDLARALTFRAGHNSAVVVAGVTLLGGAAAIVGVFTLLRKRALLSDALSHAGLPGVCVAYLAAHALGINAKSLPVLLTGAALFGALAVGCVHLLTLVPRWKQDASIGAALSVFFALGVALLSYIQGLRTGDQAGLQSFVFGQAAALSLDDARLIGVCAVGVALLALLAFKALRLACFDPAFGRSVGWRMWLADAIMMGMVVAVTSLGLQAVGIVLIIALLIIPAAAARLWTERLPRMLGVAAGLGALSGYLGASASAAAPRLPTGALIVCVCGTVFAFSLLFAPARGLLAATARRARLRRSIARQRLLRAIYEFEESGARDVAPARLVALRSWSSREVRALLARAARAGEAEASPAGWRLTERGRREGARFTRNHRLWERYLIAFADVAPGQVDRAADDVEHALGADIVATLEASLTPPPTPSPAVPPSPHPISSGAR